VLIESLLVAGVLVLPLPALVLGVPGVARHPGLGIDDKLAFALLVALRALTLLVVFVLSGLTLLTAIGAMVRHRDLPSLVYTFVVLDLLLAALVLLTFGRRDRRPVRRRATPAAR
jgi:hypothetical protein